MLIESKAFGGNICIQTVEILIMNMLSVKDFAFL